MKHYEVTVVLDMHNDVFEQVSQVTGYEIVDGILVLTTENSTVGYKYFEAFVFEEQEKSNV